MGQENSFLREFKIKNRAVYKYIQRRKNIVFNHLIKFGEMGCVENFTIHFVNIDINRLIEIFSVNSNTVSPNVRKLRLYEKRCQ